jgi:hypothetical protein
MVAAALAAALALASCSGSGPDRRPAPPPSSPPQLGASHEQIATSTGPFRAGPVRAPAAGSYLGAWVRPPDRLTQDQRIAAVDRLEGALGRRLAIVNTYRQLDDEFFTASDREFTSRGATIMLSWAGGDTRSITSGRHDDLIRERAREVKAFRKPVLLRFRWEMDRPNLRASMWSPEDYVAAWKHVRAIFAAERATNASWVWCPTAEGFAGGYAPPFYPGDDQVDWVCVDVYAGARFAPLGELLAPFLRWSAQRPEKPIMIGEFGVAKAWGAQRRAAWLRDARDVFKANPQIRAVLYFESDPDNGDGPYQEFRLTDDPPALAAFTELAREPHFNP